MDGAGKIAQWGLQTALPFWAEHGWDDIHGGFREAIGFDGAPIPGETRRVRVQVRQIYVFARAHHEGWMSGLDLAEEAASLLQRRAWQADGAPGWAHRLSEDGAIIEPVRDLYDHAFILLALAWLGRASGKAAYFDLADETLAFLDNALADPAGGYRESLGGPQSPRRQNPHMHLFEALLALFEVTGRADILARATAIKTLFDQNYFDPQRAVLREFYEADWRPAPGAAGELVEPGHLCEWSWLLHEYHRLSGEALSPAASALFETAMQHGINARSGLLNAGIDSRGAVVDASSRAWMQTEWLRTAALRHRLGHAGSAAPLEQAGRAVQCHLNGVVSGGWIDQFDGDGSVMSERIPASTLYHLFGGFAECAVLGGSRLEPTGIRP